MQTLRSVLGVVLGYLVGTAAGIGIEAWLFGDDLEGEIGPRLLALVVLAGAYALAGFLAATIAGRRRLLHAGIVAGLFALVTLTTLAKVGKGFEVEPTWYAISVLGVGATAILLGGYLATLIRLGK